MEINGVVLLLGCSLASNPRGELLMARLSLLWPGRRVVGFVGEMSYNSTTQNRRQGEHCSFPGWWLDNSWADIGHPQAVIMLNGRVIPGPLGPGGDLGRRIGEDFRARMVAH
jgi:hypothetical protein